jgi:thiol-disulfide isomerase/thioredoxin
MSSILNQYSYVFISLFAIVVVVIGLRRLRQNWLITAAAGLVMIALALGGWFALRPGVSDVDSAAAAEAVINSGKPTFVEFYSNYCAGCMSARPVVDTLVADIETRYPDAYNVLRVDIHTDFGRTLRERYGFSFSPEFVLFNSAGTEVWRSHAPPSLEEIDRVITSVESISDSNFTQ